MKKPLVRVAPSARKIPRVSEDPTSFHDLHPSWRIAKMEFCDPYGWHSLDAAMLSEIREKLKNFETMTWAQILIANKKHNHSVSVADLEAPARKQLIDSGQTNIEQVVSLRLTGTQRVWGVLDRGVLHLLWWDPNHQICPAIPKHT